MTVELTSVADDEVVMCEGERQHRFVDLEPDTTYEFMGLEARTLPRPGGELLCRFATVNDVHFGETVCGKLDNHPEVGPLFESEPGEEPYPLLLNRAAVADIEAIEPAAVVVKGDLTTNGTDEEYAAFRSTYEPAFGDRLHVVRGNHDAYRHQTFAADPAQLIELDGVRIGLLDTTIPGQTNGRLTGDQIEWLDAVGSTADGPVMVMGHHPPWNPDSAEREEDYFGINPDSSEALVGALGRSERFVGYFAGHTHRNRVRRFSGTGSRPIVEVSCVKDYPGGWAEYRVFEGGILQVFRRIGSAEAMAWTERTRGMFFGLYPDYALGSLEDRCFTVSGEPSTD